MQFSFGRINISLSKPQYTQTELSTSDIKDINNGYYLHIMSLEKNDIYKRLRGVTVSDVDSEKNYEKAKFVLDEQGIVVIPGVLPPNYCEMVSERILRFVESYASFGKSLYEDDHALFQAGMSRLKNYTQFAGYEKSVINLRKGQDEGMLDIFNCDWALPEACRRLRAEFERSWLVKLVSSSNKVRTKNLNMYVNRGITHTRGFHVDSYTPQIKAFIYLSDVTGLGDGPYTFVKGSHRDSAYRRINQYIGTAVSPKTEAPVLNSADITPVLAPKGALVISDQSGIHRGWPQNETARRIVAVMNYK